MDQQQQWAALMAAQRAKLTAAAKSLNAIRHG